MAKQGQRDHELRVLGRHEVTVVVSGAVNAVVDDRVRRNGEL